MSLFSTITLEPIAPMELMSELFKQCPKRVEGTPYVALDVNCNFGEVIRSRLIVAAI